MQIDFCMVPRHFAAANDSVGPRKRRRVRSSRDDSHPQISQHWEGDLRSILEVIANQRRDHAASVRVAIEGEQAEHVRGHVKLDVEEKWPRPSHPGTNADAAWRRRGLEQFVVARVWHGRTLPRT